MNRLLHKCLSTVSKQSLIQLTQQRSRCHYCLPDSKQIVTSSISQQSNYIDDFYFGNIEDLKLNEAHRPQDNQLEVPLALNLLGEDEDDEEVSLIDKNYFCGEGGGPSTCLKTGPEVEVTENDEDLNFFDQQMFSNSSSSSSVQERFAPQPLWGWSKQKV